MIDVFSASNVKVGGQWMFNIGRLNGGDIQQPSSSLPVDNTGGTSDWFTQFCIRNKHIEHWTAMSFEGACVFVLVFLSSNGLCSSCDIWANSGGGDLHWGGQAVSPECPVCGLQYRLLLQMSGQLLRQWTQLSGEGWVSVSQVNVWTTTTTMASAVWRRFNVCHKECLDNYYDNGLSCLRKGECLSQVNVWTTTLTMASAVWRKVSVCVTSKYLDNYCDNGLSCLEKGEWLYYNIPSLIKSLHDELQ